MNKTKKRSEENKEGEEKETKGGEGLSFLIQHHESLDQGP